MLSTTWLIYSHRTIFPPRTLPSPLLVVTLQIIRYRHSRLVDKTDVCYESTCCLRSGAAADQCNIQHINMYVCMYKMYTFVCMMAMKTFSTSQYSLTKLFVVVIIGLLRGKKRVARGGKKHRTIFRKSHEVMVGSNNNIKHHHSFKNEWVAVLSTEIVGKTQFCFK